MKYLIPYETILSPAERLSAEPLSNDPEEIFPNRCGCGALCSCGLGLLCPADAPSSQPDAERGSHCPATAQGREFWIGRERETLAGVVPIEPRVFHLVRQSVLSEVRV